MHVQRSVKSVRRAKRTHYVERCERGFAPHRTRGYGRFSRRPRALFASLGAAALSRTHRSQRGLHGVVAGFTLSAFSSVVVPGTPRLLALSRSHHHFFVATMRRLAPLQRWERIWTIKLRKLYTTFCKRDRCLRTNHAFNCIPKVWQIEFLKRDKLHSLSVTNCIPEAWYYPRQPRTRTARSVASR